MKIEYELKQKRRGKKVIYNDLIYFQLVAFLISSNAIA